MTQPAARGHRFDLGPEPVSAAIAALVEPGVAVVLYLSLCLAFGQPIQRPDLLLCIFTILLLLPGRNHFDERHLYAAVRIVVGWAGVMVLLAMVGFGTRSLHLFNPQVLLWWALGTPALTIGVFYLGREMRLRQKALPQHRRRAVVVGASALGTKVAAALTGRGAPALDVLGFFDDRGPERTEPASHERRLGNFSQLAAHVEAHGIHEVYITLPLGTQPRIVRLLEQLQGTTASLYFVPDVFGISVIQGRLGDMNGVPVVGLCETPFTGVNALAKRMSDLVLASLILLAVAPLMLLIAVAVKLSSPGPVIFRQRRNGLDGQEIVVYKFRSMRTQDDGAVIRQATRGDPRITPLGAFLRRTSLDELPQFINVLQGRMSIVGPRPHAVAHNSQYRDLIKAYMVRHKVRPGITGWAQVNGLRGETDTLEKMRARVEYDLEYLRNWSLVFDLQIIARTITLLFRDQKAF